MGVIIYGGGGFGLEVEAYLRDAAAVAGPEGAPGIVGVIDQGTPRLADFLTPADQLRHFGSLEDCALGCDDAVVVAIGDPAVRLSIAGRLDAIGARLATVIHPTAYVAESATVEPGAIVGPFAFVGPKACVRRHAVLNTYASVGHDAVLGEGSVLSPYSALNGSAEVGRGCFLGTGASISPRGVLGDRSKISAGSVLTGRTEPGSLVHGNPGQARVMFAVADP